MGSLYTKEPPCTERYARWCERTANQLMVSLLLDFHKKDPVKLMCESADTFIFNLHFY